MIKGPYSLNDINTMHRLRHSIRCLEGKKNPDYVLPIKREREKLEKYLKREAA